MADLAEQYIVDHDGKRTGVILSIETFEQLMEDLHDLSVVAERRDEPTIERLELRDRLKANALPD